MTGAMFWAFELLYDAAVPSLPQQKAFAATLPQSPEPLGRGRPCHLARAADGLPAVVSKGFG